LRTDGWRQHTPSNLQTPGDVYAQAHTQLTVPLIETLAAARRGVEIALDRLLDLLDHRVGTKAERVTLRESVCDGAAEILDASGENDPALKALFATHGEVDFAAEQ
jgi:hypothetical protein